MKSALAALLACSSLMAQAEGLQVYDAQGKPLPAGAVAHVKSRLGDKERFCRKKAWNAHLPGETPESLESGELRALRDECLKYERNRLEKELRITIKGE